jgi:hypothetical protein
MSTKSHLVQRHSYECTDSSSECFHDGILDFGVSRRRQKLQRLDCTRTNHEKNPANQPPAGIGKHEKRRHYRKCGTSIEIYRCEVVGAELDRGNRHQDNRSECHPR